MTKLGAQLTPAQYRAFVEAKAQAFPGVMVQVINGNGKLVVNGRLTDADIATLQALYNEIAGPVAETTDNGFDIGKALDAQRRRNQTNHATFKRQANAMRYNRR